jgi:hypothetical protein
VLGCRGPQALRGERNRRPVFMARSSEARHVSKVAPPDPASVCSTRPRDLDALQETWPTSHHQARIPPRVAWRWPAPDSAIGIKNAQ